MAWFKKSTSEILKNQRGFSLAEIMIAAGMMGIVSVGVMNLVQDSTKANKGMTMNFEINQISQAIEGHLRDDVACRNTLVGLNPNGAGTAVTSILDKNNIVVFRGDCTLGAPGNCTYGAAGGRIFIRSMRLEQFQVAAQPFNNSTNQATLSVTFQKGPAIGLNWGALSQAQRTAIKNLSPGEGEFVKYFRVNVRRSTGAAPDVQTVNTVEDCVTERDDFLAGACAMLGGFRPTPGAAINPATDTGIIQNVTIGGQVLPHCKQVVFATWGVTPTTADYAAWAGSSNVLTADGRAQVTGLLQVEGNVQADSTLTVGTAAVPGAGSARVENDVRIDRSLGIGVAAPGAGNTGDARLAGSLGVGVAASGTAGRINTSDDVTVGGDLTISGTTTGTGNASFQANLGVGVAAPGGTNGSVRLNNSLSVGVLAPPTGAGDVQITGSLGIGSANTPETTDGRVKATRMRVMNGGRMTINDDGVWPSGTERLYVNGDIKIVQATNDTDTDHAASIGWVANKIARTLAPSAAQITSITNDIIQALPSQVGLGVIKQRVCTTMRIRNTSGSYTTGVWSAGADTCTFDIVHTVDTNTVYNFTCPAGEFVYRLTSSGGHSCSDPNKLYPYTSGANTESDCYSWGGAVTFMGGPSTEKVCIKAATSCGSPVPSSWSHQTTTFNHSHDSSTYGDGGNECVYAASVNCNIGHSGWSTHTSTAAHTCGNSHVQTHWDSNDGGDDNWCCGNDDCGGTAHKLNVAPHDSHATTNTWVACY